MGRYAFIMMVDNRIRFGDYGAVMNFIHEQILTTKLKENKFFDFAHSDSFAEITAKVKAAQEWATEYDVPLEIIELVPVEQDIACAL
jgi:hypothetical protein